MINRLLAGLGPATSGSDKGDGAGGEPPGDWPPRGGPRPLIPGNWRGSSRVELPENDGIRRSSRRISRVLYISR